jgi:hypothetical protein
MDRDALARDRRARLGVYQRDRRGQEHDVRTGADDGAAEGTPGCAT